MSAMPPLPVLQSSRVTLMVKPVGAACNLRCGYCYYLPTADDLYAGRTRRMSLDTLEALFAGYLPHAAERVTVAWQGGEPTLAGRTFFEHALAAVERHRRPGQIVEHALQTNGLMLDEEWCRFLRANRFLVGVSIDGPRTLHDDYRLTVDGAPTHAGVLRAVKRLKGFGVEHNLLCVLHDENVKHPRDLWQFMVGLGERWLQFIPAVEWVRDPAGGEPTLAPFSPRPRDYGRFLCELFDIWFAGFRDRVSVRDFDAVLNQLVFGVTPLCTFSDACHNQITVEHNGDVFGCDHFVERAWQIGRVDDAGWFTRLDEARLARFAAQKADLPEACARCGWRPYCHGGCTKHRPRRGAATEASILCEAYRAFFEHAMPRLEWLAGFLRQGVQPLSAEADPLRVRGRPPRPPQPRASHHPRRPFGR